MAQATSFAVGDFVILQDSKSRFCCSGYVQSIHYFKAEVWLQVCFVKPDVIAGVVLAGRDSLFNPALPF